MVDDFQLGDLSLGKHTEYQSDYNSGLLQAIPRSLNRQELNCVDKQPFTGSDVWHAYEMSWLNQKGKPVVALGRFSFSASSPNLIESKSFKLYLNSLNQSRFSLNELKSALRNDLASVSGGEVKVELLGPDNLASLAAQALPGSCIDDIDISVDNFCLSPELLEVRPAAKMVSETLHSHLLKSNCLITNQPDWASIVIDYTGLSLNREALLRYLISFRLHNEFHEQCVERIYCDILRVCKPEYLSVQALYTRRGGLDISPFRTSLNDATPPLRRINRQ